MERGGIAPPLSVNKNIDSIFKIAYNGIKEKDDFAAFVVLEDGNYRRT